MTFRPEAADHPKRIRLVVVGHSLALEDTHTRWRMLAEWYPVSVTLVVPRRWRTKWLGKDQVFRPRGVKGDSFAVLPLSTTNTYRWGTYLFLSTGLFLRRIKPDVVYVMHEELVRIHQQMLSFLSLWCPTAKYLFFSMNARGVPQHKWHYRWMWRRLRRTASAALCHYPGCARSLRHAGFDKRIYLQTQVGVDTATFHPDANVRTRKRAELEVDNCFVIGYAGRLVEQKGVFDLLAALPLSVIEWRLLLIGDGEARESIEKKAREEGVSEHVILTGRVPMAEVAEYMNAMDVFVIPSRTTPGWVDTFPLVCAQAMACEVAVVGSDSGAISYQLGDCGKVFPEGNVAALRETLAGLAADPDTRSTLARRGRERCETMFTIEALTRNFYSVIGSDGSSDGNGTLWTHGA